MSILFTKVFWKDATERAIKTAAQAALLSVGAAKGFNLFTLNWEVMVGFALGGALFSYLTSVASSQVGDDSSASLVK